MLGSFAHFLLLIVFYLLFSSHSSISSSHSSIMPSHCSPILLLLVLHSVYLSVLVCSVCSCVFLCVLVVFWSPVYTSSLRTVPGSFVTTTTFRSPSRIPARSPCLLRWTENPAPCRTRARGCIPPGTPPPPIPGRLARGRHESRWEIPAL